MSPNETTDKPPNYDTTPSKYIVPTGSGYLGTYTASTERTVMISTAAVSAQDWESTTIHAVTHEDGVAIVPPSETTDPLAEYTLCTRYDGARIAVGSDVIDELEVDPNDEIRVYDLEPRADQNALLLVDADEDPRVATDGGHDTDPPLELTLEYTTVSDERRRVTLIPDTGGEAWRITYETHNGEWQETGREPISELNLELTNSDRRRQTVDELLAQRGENQ